MKYYAVLTNLTDEGRKTVRERPERILQVNESLENIGVKIIGQYALLGTFDFLTILQAEDNKAVLRAAMEFGSRGTVQTITLPAIPIEEFVEEFKR